MAVIDQDIAKTGARLHSFATIYGLAHGGKSLFWHASELLFGYFLTEICALPPRQMGLILGGSMLLSALVDALTGRYLARSVTTTKRAAEVQWLGALASCLAFSVFGVSSLVPFDYRFAFALVSMIAFRLTYAFLDNPQNAMLALATADDRGRAYLSSIRYVFSGIANMAIVIVFSPVMKTQLNAMRAIGFLVTAVAIAIVGAASSWLLRKHLHRDQTASTVEPSPVATASQAPPLQLHRWPILIGMFVISIATSVVGRLEPYIVSYDLNMPFQGSTWMIAIAVGMTISQPFWRFIVDRHSLLWALRAATLIFFIGSGSFEFLSLQGVRGCVLSGLLYGCGSGGVLMTLWALAAASVRSGRTATSATNIFGILTFSSKTALAVAALGIGEFLARADYHFSHSREMIRLMSALPAASAVVCFALSYFLFARRPPHGS